MLNEMDMQAWKCTTFKLFFSFLIVDVQSMGTTIVGGQNVQMCHSLGCKQIDNYVNNRVIVIKFPK